MKLEHREVLRVCERKQSITACLTERGKDGEVYPGEEWSVCGSPVRITTGELSPLCEAFSVVSGAEDRGRQLLVHEEGAGHFFYFNQATRCVDKPNNYKI